MAEVRQQVPGGVGGAQRPRAGRSVGAAAPWVGHPVGGGALGGEIQGGGGWRRDPGRRAAAVREGDRGSGCGGVGFSIKIGPVGFSGS
ncbi:hypothetical protein CFC21_099027 [Triticum aestivum]|uniref:Uncharacterized protein n=3 Tax=Triticum TaxID=4564 RepID=A0A9R0ZJX0_TRITD|nr:hypothetical protein CFC21_099027 [Triticum aestivum]VAI78489.1 unnamed protein product [Triticum turgidum subsp. durum]